ncbi:MAG TPA: hypothetical protein VGD55_03880 [Acidothermaceae bacterium]
MISSLFNSQGPVESDAVPRFVAGRLSNGHFGVFDVLLESYVVRDVTLVFADRVAQRLNRPDTWEPTPHQLVADNVRQALTTPPPGSVSHIQ